GPLPLEPGHHLVVTLSGVGKRPTCPAEFGGEDAEPEKHDGPAGAGIRNGQDADREHREADDSDHDAVAEIGRGPFPQPAPPAGPTALDPRSSPFASRGRCPHRSSPPALHGCPGFSFTNSAVASDSTGSPSS